MKEFSFNKKVFYMCLFFQMLIPFVIRYFMIGGRELTTGRQESFHVLISLPPISIFNLFNCLMVICVILSGFLIKIKFRKVYNLDFILVFVLALFMTYFLFDRGGYIFNIGGYPLSIHNNIYEYLLRLLLIWMPFYLMLILKKRVTK